MLMNISPVEKNVSESCATLSFAQRVMSVELGPARKRTLAASVSVLFVFRQPFLKLQSYNNDRIHKTMHL